MSKRSERSTDEFLENRGANPGDGLGDEDEEEYCDQQRHDGGRWQSTQVYSSTRLCDVYLR